MKYSILSYWRLKLDNFFTQLIDSNLKVRRSRILSFKVKYEIIYLLSISCFLLPIYSQEKTENSSNDWRFSIVPSMGWGNIQAYPIVPSMFKNPMTGLDQSSALAKRTGNTYNGLTPIASDGRGRNELLTIALASEKWLIGANYSRFSFNLSPEGAGERFNSFSGFTTNNIYNLGITRNFKVGNEKAITATIQFAGRDGNFEYNNLILETTENRGFQAYPNVSFDDHLRTRTGLVGFTFGNTHEGNYIEPYVGHKSMYYYVNLNSSIGTSLDGNYLYPTTTPATTSGSNVGEVGSAKIYTGFSNKSLENEVAGIRYRYAPVRFIIFGGDIRRNLQQGAYEIRTFVNFMLHQNIGIFLGGVYAEPEINELIIRAWSIGPVYTTKF